MKNKLIFILSLFSLLLISCEKEPIPANIETLVYGKIYDSTNDIPIVNEKIKIAEYKTIGVPSGISYIFQGFVDSTTTDINGEYSLPFNTTGNGNLYQIQLDFNEQVHIPNLTESIQEENIGTQKEQNFEALRLYPINLRIITSDEINQEIHIHKQHPSRQIDPIPALNQNSVRRIWVDKNVENEINFQILTTSPYLNHSITIPLNNTSELYEYQVEISSTDFQ
ncbi:hypothetical protein FPF71_14055 [Algibacter amylolyticus]|uniref:Uncharacterized protein n=1 Tax=Algibacter amylolyticus TaxID=1608400 RepID=A0A5M7B4Z6_9FLAO|nr:hypothetical protein [Algibacter amylolyticus]KAA5823810.1 hypothetical protein F2B50_14055 [Algibacter amylolyticus]MBB5267985.1 hypothetical protein [Algibacter amylolyticus]TSJ74298.1 hypothetical protein FPF71_14055 [Algibacter amylolyticus]